MSRIGIIGAGAFGTALGCVLAKGGNDVVLWGRDMDQMIDMAVSGQNKKYLREIYLPNGLKPTPKFSELSDLDALLMVVPASQLRAFLLEHDLSKMGCPIVLCAKGIDPVTAETQDQIFCDVLPDAALAILTGPGFATEIASGKPTALTLACADAVLGTSLQKMLSTQSMRLYLTGDVKGAQLGGALKNVYAIACGIAIGAGLGESARAALMTRGYAEMTRMAQAMGADPETISGLSGLGDLALTCGSNQSRNFARGQAIGSAQDQDENATVEGVATAQSTLVLAKRYALELPIAQVVASVLAGKLAVNDALQSLMSRPLKTER